MRGNYAVRSRGLRTSVLDDVGDQLAPPGSKPWARWMLGQAKLCRHDIQRDVAGLQELIIKLEKHSAWSALGFPSFGMFCAKELDLDEDEVELIRTAKKGEALGAVIKRAKEAQPIGEHGGDRKSENTDQGSDRTLKARGETADYLTARIARDRPDVLERMKAGEFTSVRAAAMEAGIVKPVTSLKALKRAWDKASKDERSEFLDFIGVVI